jgi:hypothetical protein
MGDYEWALVTVKYTTDLGSVGGNILSEDFSTFTNHWPMDHRWFMWDSDNERLTAGQRLVFVETGIHYKLTYYNAVSIPELAFKGVSTVNAAPFDSYLLGGMTFDAECLLYRGMRLHLGVSTAGVSPMQPQYNFTYVYRNGGGWQALWRPENADGGDGVGGWDSIKNLAGDAIRIHQTADFSVF